MINIIIEYMWTYVFHSSSTRMVQICSVDSSLSVLSIGTKLGYNLIATSKVISKGSSMHIS